MNDADLSWPPPSPSINDHPLSSPAPNSDAQFCFSPVFSPIPEQPYPHTPLPLNPLSPSGSSSPPYAPPAISSPLAHVSSPFPSSSADSAAAVAARSVPQLRRPRRWSEEQLRQRRHKQREADLQRREREHNALTQLQQLLTTHDEHKHTEDGKEGGAGTVRTRTDLLEASVQHIQQLQLLVAQLTSAPHQYAASGCAMQNGQPLPLSASAYSSSAHLRHSSQSSAFDLAGLIRNSSLHSSMFVLSPVCITLLHVPTGLIADASDSFLLRTGWQRSHIVGRRMFPPLETMLREPLHLTNPHSDAMRDNRILVQGQGGRLVHSKQEPQYESSVQLAQQLLRGERDAVVAVWRGQLGDGRVYESYVHSWISEWQDSDCNGVRYPRYTTSVHSATGSVCVG